MFGFGMTSLNLPWGWEIVKKGVKTELDGSHSQYIMINSLNDVITFLKIFDSEIKNSILKAGWTITDEFKINNHDAIIFAHPTGVRKQIYWYCDKNESTFLVNYSDDSDEVKKVFMEFKCH